MGLDSLKSSVQSWLEKKKTNNDDHTEMTKLMGQFDDVYAGSNGLDDTIKESLEYTRSGLLDTQYEIQEQLEMINEERAEMKQEINHELTNLHEALSKLSQQSDNQYGLAVKHAEDACRNCIQDYESLLELMDDNDNSVNMSGDVAAISKASQREEGFFKELSVRKEAVNALLNMTQKQMDALYWYTGEGFKQINPVLRGGMPDHPIDETTYESIMEIHQILSMHATNCRVTLYRGVSSDVPMVSGSNKGLDQFSDNALIGILLTDPAFTSTSLRESDAFKEPTMLVLDAPKGINGIYVGDFGRYKNQESEFLMDGGYGFRVTKVERRNNKRYIYANVIPKKANRR